MLLGYLSALYKAQRFLYRDADKSLDQPTSRCIFFLMVRLFRLMLVLFYLYIYIYIYIVLIFLQLWL
jgi:hypothetical protein